MSNHAKYNMLCFPFAGGTAEYYLPWKNQLSKDIQVCPVQLPGRSYRWQEPVYSDIVTLVDDMLPVIKPILDARPYIIFGHSMGGYIAYELCKRLTQEKASLPGLFIVSALLGPKHWHNRQPISHLSDQDFNQFFINLGGFHPELLKHASFLKMQMSLLRNDIHLCENYHYQQPANFPFPILALAGSQDEYIRPESLLAWQEETKNEFTFHEFKGNHFYINQNLLAVLNMIEKRVNI